MEKEVSSYAMTKLICDKFNLDISKEVSLKLPATPKEIKNFSRGWANSVIIETTYGEFPYMLSKHLRNDSKLLDGLKLKKTISKTLDEVCKEAGITLSFKKVKISEGGGWYSNGFRYFFDDVYCELN